MAYTAIRRLIAARKVLAYTSDAMVAWWRQHVVDVQRDPSTFGWWYITVTAPDGGHLYDGWWRESADKTVEQAVEEAFRGARLLDYSARQQQEGGDDGV